MMRKVLCLVALATFLWSGAASADVLENIKSKGFISCGVAGKVPGFSAPDEKGVWRGLDVDYCRALASAVFNDPEKVRFVPLTTSERFTAVQTGEVDVLSRNTTWTFQRDVEQGIDFSGIIFFDGQGFMVNKNLGVSSAKELNDASICIQIGTTTEMNVSDYFATHGMTYKPVVFESADEATVIYDSGRCDVYTTDASGLAARRTTLSNPDDHIILPEIISKEPLGPSVRQGDPRWSKIARWTLFALINAEELGVNSQNVDQMLESPNPNIKRLLGQEGNFGEQFGLTNAWAYQIIKHVGNYGEIFDRNVGPNTALKLNRVQNDLWTRGGLLYAPPIR
ncbi:general L-amino acid transport system substrate-binding protein [Desulfonatronum thiosulfatophilum]|uniref:General L-amino acid transport system substrate-binding protein n=1 Tax=Desulfonatronum thiosulfatophilum TaxID=617002 RepID=A0A1G6BZ90_9BACT|nr:amino acid ABC transporter substrate-binding protein [Desulfonatronum thiosulfatophilum]SDB25939.1 general L-amino acid transport system substrate-binding protein [Desulfonatronum thiosulfatophilum]